MYVHLALAISLTLHRLFPLSFVSSNLSYHIASFLRGIYLHLFLTLYTHFPLDGFCDDGDVDLLLGELAGEEIRQMQEEVAEEQAREASRLEEEARKLAEKKEDETQQENGLVSSHSTPSPPPAGASLETLVPLQQELLQRQYSAETHQRLMMEKLREVALQHGVEGIVPPSSTSASGEGAIQAKDSLGGLLLLDSSRSGADRHHRHSHHSLGHSHSRHRRSFRAGKGSGTDDVSLFLSVLWVVKMSFSLGEKDRNGVYSEEHERFSSSATTEYRAMDCLHPTCSSVC